LNRLKNSKTKLKRTKSARSSVKRK